MPVKVKVSGAWKDAVPKVKVSGAWKDVSQKWVKVSGAWKELLNTLVEVVANYDNKSITWATDPPGVYGGDYSGLGMNIKPDGTRVYLRVSEIVANPAVEEIWEYTLSTPWDLNTSSYSRKLDISTIGGYDLDSQDAVIRFKPDGSRIFAAIGDTIIFLDLSTDWNITTASYNVDSFGDFEGSGSIKFFQIKPDGDTIYTSRSGSSIIHQHTLGASWNTNGSITYTNKSYDFSAQLNNIRAAFISDDGLLLYVVSTTEVYRYTFGTAWDLATLSYDYFVSDVSAETVVCVSLQFKPDISKMYLLGVNEFSIFQYST
jgi:hypothetical protein